MINNEISEFGDMSECQSSACVLPDTDSPDTNVDGSQRTILYTSENLIIKIL